MRELTRDKVISVVGGKDLVGVYWNDTDGSETLFECSREQADRIIAIWNEGGEKNDHSNRSTGTEGRTC